MMRISWKALALAVTLSSAPASARSPDGLLTSQAKLALWTKAGVRSTGMHVDADDGVITLYGKVPTLEQKSLADDTVRKIDGVRGVRNLLQISAAEDANRVKRADRELLEQAKRVMQADPELDGTRVSVKRVDQGVALLTGSAHSVSEELRAVTLVDRVPGMARVASEVKGPDGDDADESVAAMRQPDWKSTADPASDVRTSAMVKLRLLLAAQIPAAEISVDTEFGAVTLFGLVPTAEAKKAAATEAFRVASVVVIDNRLEVVSSIDKPRVVARDADMARDLSLAFKEKTDLQSVQSSVQHGVVRLTGTVHSGWDELSAVRVTRKVAGVRGIDDQLKVDHPARVKITQRDSPP